MELTPCASTDATSTVERRGRTPGLSNPCPAPYRGKASKAFHTFEKARDDGLHRRGQNREIALHRKGSCARAENDFSEVDREVKFARDCVVLTKTSQRAIVEDSRGNLRKIAAEERGTWLHYTPEMHAEVIRLRKAGTAWKDIAKKLNRPKGSLMGAAFFHQKKWGQVGKSKRLRVPGLLTRAGARLWPLRLR